MSSLVSELQVRAIDSNASVSELLRMAKVVASKLDLKDLREWIDFELAGYPDSEVPQYRVIRGNLKAFNPFQGLIPVSVPDEDLAVSFSTHRLRQKISEIEALANRAEDKFYIPFADQHQILLQEYFKIDFEFKLVFAPTVLAGIIDSVRNVILDWSLKLEQAGIVGEGMTFSKEDKEKAHNPSVSYQIGSIASFTGNIGSVSDHSVVNASSTAGVDTAGILNLVAQLREHSGKIGLDDSQQARLVQTLDSLKIAAEASRPEPSKLGSFLATLKKVLLSATSSLVVHGALAEIDKYSQHLPKF